MNRHMREMDNMMNSMMGNMFGMSSGFMGQQQPRQQSIMDSNPNNMLMNPFNGFGGGNLFGSLMRNMVSIIKVI